MKWVAPNEDEYKMNVDASISAGLPYFMVGMVIRDHVGQFVQGRVVKFAGVVSVLEAEAMGILEALSWLRTLPTMRVLIECDSLTAVKAISTGVDYQVEVGHIIEACRSLLAQNQDVSVHFIRRQVNKVAHLMAHEPCSLNFHNVFLSRPVFLLESIVFDALIQ